MRWHVGAVIVAIALVSPTALAESGVEGSSISDEGISTPSKRFRLKFEVKAHARHSDLIQFQPKFPFPPEFVPVGEEAVFMRTVDEGTSLEISNLSIQGEGELTPSIFARVNVHVIDLHNRNPTSTDDEIFVREAWTRFGRKFDQLDRIPATSFYAQLGKAPRFTKQTDRHLESYGLWGTSVGRFEEIGLELGGSFGRFVYWRAALANGNPLFFRDPNALAGDNGTAPPPDPDPSLQSGFPILYDAKAQDLGIDGEFQVGAGLGFRFRSDVEESRDVAFDAMGWYFKRDLEEKARIDGTFYQGDLELLRGAGIPLPFQGNEKVEWGVNFRFQLAPGKMEDEGGTLHVYGQYVAQEIAELERSGFELELAYRFPLYGVFVSGDQPVLNWIEPVVRYSTIDNDFSMPAQFVAPSMGWDWDKIDVGVRLGIIRGVDLTLEYARNDMITAKETLHPDEALLTLRTAF